MYGAAEVEYEEQAEKDIKRYNDLGFGKLPICLAKTQYSFSGDADKKGAPTGHTLTIREVSHLNIGMLAQIGRNANKA